MANFEDLLGIQDEERGILSSQRQAVIDKLAQPQTLDRGQMAAAGLLAVLPILIGAAVKGRKGVGLGAQSGALGATGLLKGIKEDQEKEELLAKDELKQANLDLAQNRRGTSQIMLKEAEGEQRAELEQTRFENSQTLTDEREDRKDARQTQGFENAKQLIKEKAEAGNIPASPEEINSAKRNLAAVGLDPDRPMTSKKDVELADRQAANAARIRVAASKLSDVEKPAYEAINNAAAATPDMAKMVGFLNKLGDENSTMEAALRQIRSTAPNSEAAFLKVMGGMVTASNLKAMFGGAPSDSERGAIDDILLWNKRGTTVGTVKRAVNNLGDSLYARARLKYDIAKGTARGGTILNKLKPWNEARDAWLKASGDL